MIIDRKLLDDLLVMHVMEDWGGKRVKTATMLVQEWSRGRLNDEKKQIVAEALCLLCPGSTFVLMDGMLGVRSDGRAPIAVAHIASYVEQERDGKLMRVIKERDPELSSQFRARIDRALDRKQKSAASE